MLFNLKICSRESGPGEKPHWIEVLTPGHLGGDFFFNDWIWRFILAA
jgi:hypothetical protein